MARVSVRRPVTLGATLDYITDAGEHVSCVVIEIHTNFTVSVRFASGRVVTINRGRLV